MATALPMIEVYSLTNDKKSVRFHGACHRIWNGEQHGLKT
jgi:hypothetical protein